MYSLEDDARGYLSRVVGITLTDEVPFEAVKTCINKAYDGGWSAFEADFRRVMSVVEKKTELTPFQKWAKVSRMVPPAEQLFHLRPHQEVKSVDIGENEIKAVLRIARTTEKATRDVVQYGYKLIVWTRTESGWSQPESIEVFGEEAEEIVRWGRVRTPDYVASQREQYEECYRPGTEKSPMQGPAARLGVTREELHNLPKGK